MKSMSDSGTVQLPIKIMEIQGQTLNYLIFEADIIIIL
jgi:hypothetical protein